MALSRRGGRAGWVEVSARLLLATRAVDSGFRWFERARSALVAARASDEVLARFSELAYGDTESYRADEPGFRDYLFPWEEYVIGEFFPPPPARILVGGAGGGREALALARMGYTVVAFDPSPVLASSLARVAPPGCDAFRGSYEELPRLFAARPGDRAARLDELAPFDGSIIGWGSFSHLPREDLRLRTLSSFRTATKGPIVASFLGVRNDAPEAVGRLKRWLPRRHGRSPGDIFSVFIGYYHLVSRSELARLAEQAGLEVRYLNFDQRDTNWPHVVLFPGSGGIRPLQPLRGCSSTDPTPPCASFGAALDRNL
jgi:hypothetical protein